MPEEYLREQLWKLYEKLPEELKEALSSIENADSIYDICQKNKVAREKTPKIVKLVGRVLMGLLPPDEFEETLVKEVKLKEEVAKSVSREITRFIFFPVKEVLSRLYEIEIAPPARPKEAVELEEKPAPEAEEKRKPDVYREAIE